MVKKCVQGEKSLIEIDLAKPDADSNMAFTSVLVCTSKQYLMPENSLDLLHKF